MRRIYKTLLVTTLATGLAIGFSAGAGAQTMSGQSQVQGTGTLGNTNVMDDNRMMNDLDRRSRLDRRTDTGISGQRDAQIDWQGQRQVGQQREWLQQGQNIQEDTFGGGGGTLGDVRASAGGQDQAGVNQQGVHFSQLAPSQVRELQSSLRQQGYSIAVDGIWGPQTASALQAFQRQNNMNVVNNRLNQQTASALGLNIGMGQQMDQGQRVSATNLDQGAIRDIQSSLQQQGHSLAVDGIWGPQTASALREFQRQHNLDVTGSLDSETVSALDVNINGTRRFQ